MKNTINTSTTTTSASSSIHAHAHAREEVNAEFQTAMSEYQDAIGRPMPRSIQDYVWARLASHDWQLLDLSYALAETAAAPCPSWRYTLAIMRRLTETMPWERESRKTDQGRE